MRAPNASHSPKGQPHGPCLPRDLQCYGFWLSNDPRGSWSDWIRSWKLFLAGGPATKTDTRHSVAHVPHDRENRERAKAALKYTPVEFTGAQALAVAQGFRKAVEESGYVIYACSILPRHVHAVIERHERPVEQIIGHLKARATQKLIEEGLHPFVGYRGADGRFPSVWAHRAWKVFLDSREDVVHATRYVERNPAKEGKNAQEWSFLARCPYL